MVHNFKIDKIVQRAGTLLIAEKTTVFLKVRCCWSFLVLCSFLSLLYNISDLVNMRHSGTNTCKGVCVGCMRYVCGGCMGVLGARVLLLL